MLTLTEFCLSRLQMDITANFIATARAIKMIMVEQISLLFFFFTHSFATYYCGILVTKHDKVPGELDSCLYCIITFVDITFLLIFISKNHNCIIYHIIMKKFSL